LEVAGTSSSSQFRTNAILDASGGNTATINSMTPTAQSLQGFRNRIINGAMVIAQRGTSAVTLGGSSSWPVDRMLCFGRASGTGITGQQSTVAPAGYTNSLLYTVTTGATPVGGDYPQIGQVFEGFNVADLGYGTANAQTITISFWVRSSVTGTYGFCVQNGALNRSYVAQYTVSAANTWEYKTITVSGDTSGTWATNNTAGLRVVWDMGFGFGATATPNVWQAGQAFSVSGNVKLAATTGATFYITGVQVEAGSVATPFERRDYGTELARCQRYYVGGFVAPGYLFGVQNGGTATEQRMSISEALPVEMRATPTVTYTFTSYDVAVDGGLNTITNRSLRFRGYTSFSGGYWNGAWDYRATAEL
jgi:hypothetical protein